MTNIVSGNTWPYRGILRQLGGYWKHDEKYWTFSVLTNEARAVIRTWSAVKITDPEQRPATKLYGDDPTYFNYFKDKDPLVFFGFSSLRKFADYVASLTRPEFNDGIDCDLAWHTDRDYRDFSGTRSLDEAISLARDGWTDGLGLGATMLVPRPRSKQRSHSLAGGSVSVGRMLAGNPVHMIRRKPAPGHRSITLFVDAMLWKGITALSAMVRALVIAGMVDVLETEGYRCTIVTVACDDGLDGEPKTQFAVRVKDAGERLSLLDVSFALGHPAFLRRLCFAAEGCAPELPMSEAYRGTIAKPFDECADGEFYIPWILTNKFENDPLGMLDLIEPVGLPISVRDRICSQ